MCFFKRQPSLNLPVSEPDPIPPLPGNVITPDSPYIRVTDHCGIDEQSATRLRFLRPNGVPDTIYWWAAPGARAGIRTNATSVTFRVYSNGLGLNSRDYTASVLVNNVEAGSFETGAGGAGIVDYEVVLGSATMRDVDLVWPYSDGVDLIQISVNVGATLALPSSRPSERIRFYGDSITHGFTATKTTASWPWLLAMAKNRRLENFGYGSRRIVAGDAALIGSSTDTDAIIFMGGYNNFNDQQAAATFQTAVEGWLTAVRTANPNAPIYACSTPYTTTVKAIPIADYRTAVADAVTAVGDGNTTYIDGLALMTNTSDRLADGIHPNDLGASEIVASMSALIT